MQKHEWAMQSGETCRNAVNVSVCRFCDFHVQGEFKRLNSSRGPLMTATVGARLGARAKAAGMPVNAACQC